jgi:hypothetical protein
VSGLYATVNLGSNSPSILIEEGDPPTILQNLSLTDTAWLGSDSGVSPGLYSSIQLQPGGSITLDGSVCSTWGICAAGGSAQILKIPGGLNYAVGAATIAAAILASGISLLANPQAVFNVASPVSLPTSGVQQFITPVNQVTMGNGSPGAYIGNFLGYEFSLVDTCSNSEVAGTFSLVKVDFFENQSDTVPIDTIFWEVAAAAAGKTTYGKGPMRGQYIQLSMFNGSTSAFAQSLTSLRWNGSGRTYGRDDWRDVNAGNVTTGGFKQTLGNMQQNEVAADNALANGGGTVLNRLCNNFAGRVKVFINVLGMTTKQNLFQFQEAAGSGAQVERVFLGDASTQIFEAEYVLPRSPMLLTFTNSSGVAATISYSVIAQDY